MIRINVLFCCGGGFSSSAMVSYITKGIEEHHLEDEISFTFCPFTLSAEKFHDYDILVACPHLDREIKAHDKRYIKNQIPMYVLPPRMYGPVGILELYQDIKDVLAMFEKNPSNPVQFPGACSVPKHNRMKTT